MGQLHRRQHPECFRLGLAVLQIVAKSLCPIYMDVISNQPKGRFITIGTPVPPRSLLYRALFLKRYCRSINITSSWYRARLLQRGNGCSPSPIVHPCTLVTRAEVCRVPRLVCTSA